MAEYHLQFWAKTQGAAEIRRVYVNGPDRSSLGYFEERIASRTRGDDTYYDQHRAAKGDTIAEVGRTYTYTLPDDVATAIYGSPAIAAHIAAGGVGDDFERFDALVKHSRGVRRLHFHGAKTPAGRAERSKVKSQEAYTIAL